MGIQARPHSFGVIMADTFQEVLNEDRDNIILNLNEFAAALSYRAIDETVTAFTGVPEEQVGALDDKQNKLFRFSASVAFTPERNGEITHAGDVWIIVDIRVDDLGMFEVRTIKPEARG